MYSEFVVELDFNEAYWMSVGGRYDTNPVSVRGGRRQVSVTSHQGITKTYKDGDEAAKEWPTERLTCRRGGYFERSTRRIVRPEQEPPRRVDPRYWSEQEALLDEMYVDLREVD